MYKVPLRLKVTWKDDLDKDAAYRLAQENESSQSEKNIVKAAATEAICRGLDDIFLAMAQENEFTLGSTFGIDDENISDAEKQVVSDENVQVKRKIERKIDQLEYSRPHGWKLAQKIPMLYQMHMGVVFTAASWALASGWRKNHFKIMFFRYNFTWKSFFLHSKF
mgnify:CR=1 FL=1